MPGQNESPSNQQTRLQELLQSIPFVTLCTIIVCVCCFLLTTATSAPLGQFTIAAFPVVFEGEWFRIISSAFLHASVMHIAMNMFSLYAMGSSLVRQVQHPRAQLTGV